MCIDFSNVFIQSLWSPQTLAWLLYNARYCVTRTQSPWEECHSHSGPWEECHRGSYSGTPLWQTPLGTNILQWGVSNSGASSISLAGVVCTIGLLSAMQQHFESFPLLYTASRGQYYDVNYSSDDIQSCWKQVSTGIGVVKYCLHTIATAKAVSYTELPAIQGLLKYWSEWKVMRLSELSIWLWVSAVKCVH